ncbi:MAG: HAMP domain-containing histidine kinase [Nocardioidaceae bacterium]|nr:HAMP domain-containing histidine kinase [Nocardioidaceae bacterium]
MVAPVQLARRVYVRSIQARVVISILLLSAIVITLVGVLLTRQIAEGLTQSKADQAVSEGAAGVQFAQGSLDAEPPSSTQGTQSLLLNPLQSALVSRGGAERSYEIVLVGPIQSSSPVGARYSDDDLSLDVIPLALQDKVADGPGLASTYTRMPGSADGAQAVPAVVVGSQVRVPSTGDVFGLYYLFPMDDEQQALSLVRRGLISAGVALMALIAGVAWLVTRQVVTPVGLARRIAERLAAGRLEERMHIRGEDDLARLGTSFNKMAESLQRQIRQLEELSRVQQRFVSDVSHELRTPLTTVRMAADVLHDARPSFDPVSARSAELLQAELDRFQDLLTDLLEISRFDAGAAELEVETVDLVTVAQQVVDSHVSLAARAQVTLVVVAHDPVLVDADVRRIERIVRNLIGNAIRYSHSERVEVRVAGDDHAVALAVRDWGVGLHAGESTLVFNRFWRADPARARAGGGTGLGLAIAREDAMLHGGWLQAWGAPGQGTQFRLTLARTLGDEIEKSPLPLLPDDGPMTSVGGPYARVEPPPGPVVMDR